MNPKKLVVSIVTSVVTLASLGALAVSAEDVSNPYYGNHNVKTFVARHSGKYALYYGRTDYTSVTASKGGYSDSYKFAQYIQYGERAENNYYRIDFDDESGNTNTVMTDSIPITGKVARRFHKARIHLTSESTSSVQETFTASITKW